MAVRLQRKRTKGWKAPEGAVYVGRPTKWGNPFPLATCGSHEEAVIRYRKYVLARLFLGSLKISDLRGKDLMCWCPLDQPCHADVLLEIANAPEVQP